MTARDSSRKNWNGGNERDLINMGSLQRIADACELMAERHSELIREKDYMAAIARSRAAEIDRLERRLAATKGVVTRLKRRLAELENKP